MGGHVIDVTNSIDCNTDCTKTLPINTQVTLEAVPDSGYAFLKWEDGSTDVRHTLIVMNRDINVNAIFILGSATHYTLTIIRGDVNKGTITDVANGISWTVGIHTQLIATGTSVQLSVVPETDYTFLSWIDGDPDTALAYTPFLMTANKTFQPRFKYVGSGLVTLWIEFVGGIVHGVVNDGGNDIHCTINQQSFQFPPATIITLVATPNIGYDFVHWNNNVTLTSATLPGFSLTANSTVYVTFAVAAIVPIILSITLNLPNAGTVITLEGTINCGNGGTICSHAYYANQASVILITPNSGFRISKIDTILYPISSPTICPIARYITIGGSNITVDVEFEVITHYTLTIIRGSINKGTISDLITPAYGINQTIGIVTYQIPVNGPVNLSVVAATDYDFYTWIDGDPLGAGTTIYPTFAMTANKTFQPRFTYVGAGLVTLWITFTAGSSDHGSIIDTDEDVYCRVDTTFTFPAHTTIRLIKGTIDPGYVFTKWTYNSIDYPSTYLPDFSLDVDTTVFVTISPVTHYTLTIIRGDTNKGTISDVANNINQTIGLVKYQIPVNGPVNLSVVPATGFNFLSWIDGDPIHTLYYPQFAMISDKTFQPRFTSVIPVGSISLTIRFTTGIPHGNIRDLDEELYCETEGEIFYFVSGTVIELVAHANSGYSFSSWTGGCTDPFLPAFSLTVNTVITATFTTASASSCILTINIIHPLHGKINVAYGANSIDVSNSINFVSIPSGIDITLTAVPTSPYTFINWETFSGDPNRPKFTLTADKTVTATFEL